MASQVSLAEKAGLDIRAVVALQHIAAVSLNMVSRVRILIACSLAGTPELERATYKKMLPFVIAIVAVLALASLMVWWDAL